MIGNKEYTGIVLEGKHLKIARITTGGGGIRLEKLDKLTLISELKHEQKAGALAGGGMGDDEMAGDIFDLESDADDTTEEIDLESLDELTGGGAESDIDEEEEFEDFSDLDDLDTMSDFDDLDDLEEDEGEDLDTMDDMVNESGESQSNELLLLNTLSEIDPKKVYLGLNIEAGDTIFQIIRDTDFNEVKKKDLIIDLEEKLESIYGEAKSSDRYAYEIRENGSLLLASIDQEPRLLKLIDDTRQLYDGQVRIDEVMPDEVILVGMLRANYELPPDQITGIIQFGTQHCRLIFMKGEEIWMVSPIINEGTDDKRFLSTIFSKVLFQLDTGEVPNLDLLILANNTVGGEAVDYFRENFPDLQVENFRFNEEVFDIGEQDPAIINSFTTAIGTAWAASGANREYFPDLSLLPSYVKDRQKIFKLQWHGVLLLLMIFLSPLVINHFYQQNSAQIDLLQAELNTLNTQLAQITPTVNAANQLTDQLAIIQEDLVLLDTLSRGTLEWSRKLNLLNNGIRTRVSGTWFTGFSTKDEQVVLEGYSIYRNQIPNIVDLFHDATLLSVGMDEIREMEVYQFTIQIREFIPGSAAYSPERPEDLRLILGK